MPRIKLLLLLIIFHFATAEKIPSNSESCAPGNFVHERKALYYSWSRMVVGYVDTWKSKECVSGNSNPLSCGITYFYVAVINFEDDERDNKIDASKLTVKCSDNMIYSASELPNGVEPNILYKSYLNCQGEITVNYTPPPMVYLKYTLYKVMFLCQDIFLYLFICVIFVEICNRIIGIQYPHITKDDHAFLNKKLEHLVNTFTQRSLSKAISPFNILEISCDSDSVITRPCIGVCVDFKVVSKCTNLTVEAQVKGCSDDLIDYDPEAPPMSYFVEDEEDLAISAILTVNSSTYVFEVEYCGDSFESFTGKWNKEKTKTKLRNYEPEYFILRISIFIGIIYIIHLIIQDHVRMNELEIMHRRLNPTIPARGERA